MAKVNSLVNLVLMSIVTAVRFTISQLAAFNRVTSIGGGLMGYNYYPRREARVCNDAFHGSC